MKKVLFLISIFLCFNLYAQVKVDKDIEKKIANLISQMTLEEKISQMHQMHYGYAKQNTVSEKFQSEIQNGNMGSFLNISQFDISQEVQKIASQKSRMKIPLLIGRDVIHGYKTIFPIPLAMSCSWDTVLIEKSARVAAVEASADGIRWTFSPMIDIARDARWGRIAEGYGEDPFLTSKLGRACILGYQGKDLTEPTSLAACAKHFVGYGAAEGGRDYNTTLIPESELRNIYLPSFHEAKKAGVQTYMSAFNDLNGEPASGNAFTLDQILRKEWGFDGFVVSDWESVAELIKHGYAADEKEAAYKAVTAGVDMEMVSNTYTMSLAGLIKENPHLLKKIDQCVANILRVKFRLGLFENPIPQKINYNIQDHWKVARECAQSSIVLLKNRNNILPLSKKTGTIAIIGPMANNESSQLGCWSMDGDKTSVITPLTAFRKMFYDTAKICFAQALNDTRSKELRGFSEAINVAKNSDVILLFLGEDDNMSGEAKCRAFLDLPGAQKELLDTLATLGKPIILVILAGRPLTFSEQANKADAILYAWHPGTMGGMAIADIVFGDYNPSAKLTTSFPRYVGQIPLYYNFRNTGRPISNWSPDIKLGDPTNPKGYVAQYLDVAPTPEYPFGYGLSYTTFEYSATKAEKEQFAVNEKIKVSATIKNTGKIDGSEIVQLYIRDLSASITRPVKELKRFKKVFLKAGESISIQFEISANDLGFYNNQGKFLIEPGKFDIWIAPNSAEGIKTTFLLK